MNIDFVVAKQNKISGQLLSTIGALRHFQDANAAPIKTNPIFKSKAFNSKRVNILSISHRSSVYLLDRVAVYKNYSKLDKAIEQISLENESFALYTADASSQIPFLSKEDAVFLASPGDEIFTSITGDVSLVCKDDVSTELTPGGTPIPSGVHNLLQVALLYLKC